MIGAPKHEKLQYMPVLQPTKLHCLETWKELNWLIYKANNSSDTLNWSDVVQQGIDNQKYLQEISVSFFRRFQNCFIYYQICL